MKLRLIASFVAAGILLAFGFFGCRLLSARPDAIAPASNAAKPASPAAQPPLPPSAETTETSHYAIHSSATEEQTTQVASAVEALYTAYTRFFAGTPGMEAKPEKLQLVLYKDQAEFKAHNRSSPWAEAYYLPPRCHAYYADGDNPVHWMIHEAAHQLNREVAHFKQAKWIDEGLATYFGTSWIADGKLTPGSIDPDTYPIWWLSKLSLTGNLQDDIASGKIIPLRTLVSGKGGPDINRNFNLYYIEYWSLSHFLFHYQNGKYADKYKQLIAAGGSLENFENIVGPIGRIQEEWYAYLQDVANAETATRISIQPSQPAVEP